MGRAVLQYSHCTCDTALGWARKTRAAGAVGGFFNWDSPKHTKSTRIGGCTGVLEIIVFPN